MKWLTSIWSTLGLITLLISIQISNPNFLQQINLITFDQAIQSLPDEKSDQIILLDIGEGSLGELGQFPLPRHLYAQMISDLRNANAGLIGFTIMFPEVDRLGGDEVFASWIKDNGIVLAQDADPNGRSEKAPYVGTAVFGTGDPLDWAIRYNGLVTNIPMIEDQAWGVGLINGMPEVDGVTRRIPLLSQINNELYPSFSLETIRILNEKPSYTIKVNDLGIEEIILRPFQIPTDANGSIWLNTNYEFERYEYGVDTLPNLQGKTIIVGLTASGVASQIATPVGLLPAHHLQAMSLQTILSDQSISRPIYGSLLEIGLTLIGSLLIVLGVYYLPLWASLITFISLSSGVLGGFWYSWTNFGILLSPTIVILIFIISFASASFNNFWVQFKLRQEIQKQFAGYCSPTVVRMLQENPSLIKDGMKREISICFSDLRGFTPLGESFGDDVKGLTKLMNEYMDAITQPVLNADGMIIKYIGDASMHVHNAPNDDPNHPKSAVQTGLNMLKAVERFNEKITAEGRPPIGMGAGINSGLGYLGEMGSTSRHSYDVLGDAVSTAARIESKCKEYGCLLLVGESTVKQCEEDFFFLKIDDLAVKGKSVGIGIYTVLDTWFWAWHNTDWPSRQDTHNKMHELYRSQQFDMAIKFCNDLKGEFDGKMDNYYDMWIERCEYMKTQDLPKDWDGVFIATTK